MATTMRTSSASESAAHLLKDVLAVKLDRARRLTSRRLAMILFASPAATLRTSALSASGLRNGRANLVDASLDGVKPPVGGEAVADGFPELVFATRFLQQRQGAVAHRPDGAGSGGEASQHDHRDVDAAANQFFLKFETAHADHANVGYQAGRSAAIVGGEKLLGRVEAERGHAHCFDERRDGLAGLGVVATT